MKRRQAGRTATHRRKRRALLLLAPAVALVTAVGYSTSTATAATFESCDQWAEWRPSEGYRVHNNIWGGGAGRQCIYADSPGQWTVNADHPDTGGIKSYPNATREINRRLSELSTLNGNFAASTPHAGAYNTTFDIWTENWQHEIMLWFNWYGPVGPIGGKVTQVNVGGHTWDVYKGNNGGSNVYSFLNTSQTENASVDARAILQWVADQGWMRQDELITDVQFGYEITSSPGGMDFRTNNFGVDVS